MMKMHAETFGKRKRAPTTFAEKVCVDIGYCQKWVDPEVEEKIRLEEEAVFW